MPEFETIGQAGHEILIIIEILVISSVLICSCCIRIHLAIIAVENCKLEFQRNRRWGYFKFCSDGIFTGVKSGYNP